MKRLGYVLVGLVAYGFFMLQQLPAALLVERAVQRLPGMSVERVEGSALRGTVSGLRWQGALVQSLTWRLRGWPLLLGRVEYALLLDAPDLHLSAVAGMGLSRALYLTDLQGHLPLPKAIALVGRPPPPVNGKVEIEQVALSLGKSGLPQAAQGKLRLLDAHTSFGRTFTIGNFSVELKTENPNILAAIEDNGGPLDLSGTLTLTPNGRYRFSGQAAVRDDNRELRQALNLIARPGGNGTWKISFTGILQV